MKKYNDTNNVYNINYHITWITKYRIPFLNTKIQEIFKKILIEKSNELDILIKAIEIMTDYIHIFISCKPTQTVSKIINSFKGYSSFQIRKMFLYLKKYKSLWTCSYFCETIGFISEKTIIKYINNQKNK